MKNLVKIVFVLFLAMASCEPALKHQKLELPSIISDHMVLQQNAEAKLWGWTDPTTEVVAEIQGHKVATTSDAEGNWKLALPELKAGGPYELKISAGTNVKNITDVLVGENWVGSGQSNMQWSMKQSLRASTEIPKANFKNIRLFNVPRVTAGEPQNDVEAEWVVCTPENVEQFSAVLYYFGKKLHQDLDMPFGLIHTSWGGTPAEAWTSKEAMDRMPEIDFLKKRMQPEVKGSEEDFALFDKATNDAVGKTNYSTKIEDIVGVYDVLTGENKRQGFPGVLTVTNDDGKLNAIFSWQKVTKNVAFKNDELTFSLMLKAYSPDPFDIKIKFVDGVAKGAIHNSDGINTNPINGLKRKDPKKGLALRRAGGTQNYPSYLYNAMLKPLMPYTIKGAIWYQGEGNVSRAHKYHKLFSNMITDWRTNWGQGDFPFYFVQIAPYKYNKIDGIASAELREAQFKTLSLPNTGMAVITDIGNVADIHPTNKLDVGNRLALWALAKDYDKSVVYSGPLYKSMKVDGNKIILHFDSVGGGLVAKDGDLTHFTIAGDDQKFVEAKAVIVGNTVEVSSPKVSKPVAARFGFTDIATPNFYNKEGLPATTFRTDTWKGSTE